MTRSRHSHEEICLGCEDRLKQASELIITMFRVIKEKHPETHTSWVYRNEAEQDKAVSTGESMLRFPKSKHNILPSQAMDIFQIDKNGQAIFDPQFCYQAKKELMDAGFKFRWGGDFKSLGDYGHFELI